LLGAAERSSAVNAVMFNYRHHPVVRELKALVQNGVLGDIYSVHGSYLQDWLLLETDYSWRVDAEIGGTTRVVADIGSSWLDLAQFITGQRITEIVGDMQTFIPVRQKSVSTVGTFGASSTPRLVSAHVSTEDYAAALFRFENGARGALTLSQVSAGRKNQLYIQIDGSKKSAAWNQEQPEKIWFGYQDRPDENPPKKGGKKAKRYDHFPGDIADAWGISVDNFLHEVYKYIAAGKDPKRDPAPFTTFEDGHEAAVLTDRILDSNRQGRWVKTGLVPE
jgi:predicted dehydrogenase